MSGKIEIDAGQVLFAGERHADIDDQPGAARAGRPARRSRDSCRSRRRRRAARTRVRLRTGHCYYLAANEHVARRHGLHCPIGKAENQAARFVDAFRTGPQARHRPICTRMGLPTPAARASQSARIAAKPAPRFHCARRATIAADSGANRLSGVGADAGRGEIGRRIIGAGRMMHAIDADADRHASSPSPSTRMPANLLRSISRSFGHFSTSRLASPGCARRWRRAAPAPRRTTARASAPAAPDRSGAGSRRDCPAPTPRCGRAGRAPRSGAWR